SGFFRVNETTFLLEPLEGAVSGRHALYRAAHLRGKRRPCREAGDTPEVNCLAGQAASLPLPLQKSGPTHKGPRYVELVLVADNEEFRKHRDLRTVQNRMKEIVNHVDKLYQPLRLRVALIGLGGDFHGKTVGLAKKLVMCTRDSGAVSQDHSTNPIGAASTMAHEMGHNLGMSHDEDVPGCHCPLPKADGGCVMAGSVGHLRLVHQTLFLLCKTRLPCVPDASAKKQLVGEGSFGGLPGGFQSIPVLQECSDRCCNASTCQLREGAECAQGECCQDCKVKAAGVLCRASKNDCDLPEHCTGLSAECREDMFQENGISCQNGNGYCYNGGCPSHGEQCRALWGAEAQVAPDVCF
ncbi:Disintegrin and metalloproteinase domain-containing protein 8, partial [Manacus vitellinus]